MSSYGSIAYTEGVREAQRRMGSPLVHRTPDPAGDVGVPHVLGPEDVDFIQARDGFYQASVSETGWPYLQFRGGPAGFVRAVGPTTLGYADLRGNRQYISVGNLGSDDRVALFFMDYPGRTRLKVFGRVRLIEDPEADELQALVAHADRGRVERAVLIDVVATDWNCPQHITSRWTAAEVEGAVQPLRDRIADLERQLAQRSGVPGPE